MTVEDVVCPLGDSVACYIVNDSAASVKLRG